MIVAAAPAFDLGLASMHSSPPLEPHPVKSYYYITDAQADWPAERQDAWLQKFNYATLADISAHEVAPGHYVHSLFMRRTPGKIRRIWIGLNPFPQPSSGQDGWAHYAEQLVSDEGFKRDDPRYRLAQISEALTRICRLIAGLRLHSGEWTIDQAAALFEREAHLPAPAARQEAVRGTYDPTYGGYFLGKLAAIKLRRDYQAARGAAFNLREFHERVMTNGIAPWWAHRQLLLPAIAAGHRVTQRVISARAFVYASARERDAASADVRRRVPPARSPARFTDSVVIRMKMPGREGEPRFGAERGLRLVEHVAPARLRRPDADAEEAERRLDQDSARDRQRQRHDDGLRRVRQQVPRGSRARGRRRPPARSRRSRAPRSAPELRAHHARRFHPADQADQQTSSGTDGWSSAAAIISSGSRGIGEHRVGAAHQRGVDRAAGVAGDAADATPDAPATAADSRPTASDTRAPYSTRASTSRPRSSVPNQCAADGGSRALREVDLLRRDTAPGSGAASAAANQAARAPAPAARIMPSGDRGSSARVRRIRRDVEHDDRGRGEHQQGHQHGVVAPRQRLGEQAAEARPREHALGDDRARHQQRRVDQSRPRAAGRARCAARGAA